LRYRDGHVNRLALADMLGVGWIGIHWMNNPDSGATPWLY